MKNNIFLELLKIYRNSECRIKNAVRQFEEWAKNNFAGLFVFNLVAILLVLLNTAGYFHPFLPLTINLIVFLSMLMGVVFLKIRSKAIFFLSFLFLIFAALLLAANVRIWSERSMIYVYQSFSLGIVILFFERPVKILR